MDLSLWLRAQPWLKPLVGPPGSLTLDAEALSVHEPAEERGEGVGTGAPGPSSVDEEGMRKRKRPLDEREESHPLPRTEGPRTSEGSVRHPVQETEWLFQGLARFHVATCEQLVAPEAQPGSSDRAPSNTTTTTPGPPVDHAGPLLALEAEKRSLITFARDPSDGPVGKESIWEQEHRFRCCQVGHQRQTSPYLGIMAVPRPHVVMRAPAHVLSGMYMHMLSGLLQCLQNAPEQCRISSPLVLVCLRLLPFPCSRLASGCPHVY